MRQRLVRSTFVRHSWLESLILVRGMRVAISPTEGGSRLAMAMLGPQAPITLRPACPGDESLLLRWANDPQLCASSSSLDPIPSSEYHNWFQQRLVDPNCLFLIATAADGCPLGQIRFDRQPPSAQDSSAEAKVDMSLDRCARGFGLAGDLVRLGLHVMEQAWGPDIEAVSEVLTSNQVSNACFSRFGVAQMPISPTVHSVSGSDSFALPPTRITILSDRSSWLNRYLAELIKALWQRGHAVRWIHHPTQLSVGDVCLLLSCGRLLSAKQLALHRYNLVVHESALPYGQGWSPMTWQILNGATSIPVSLFEAVADLDAGPIYLQKQIHLEGHELVDEWRALQAQATVELCWHGLIAIRRW